MAVANFEITAEDGWVEVTSAGTDFVIIRSNTPSHAFFVADGSSAPSTANTSATGTITVSGQPTDGDTVTINGVVLTFVTADDPDDDYDVEIGTDAEETHDNLIAVINDVLGDVVTAADTSSTVITLTSVVTGPYGNGVSLAEDADNVTVSGSNLTGGTSAPKGFKVQCGEFWCDAANTNKYYVRVLENLPQKTRIDVFYIAS
jgi:hypothetical protein